MSSPLHTVHHHQKMHYLPHIASTARRYARVFFLILASYHHCVQAAEHVVRGVQEMGKPLHYVVPRGATGTRQSIFEKASREVTARQTLAPREDASEFVSTRKQINLRAAVTQAILKSYQTLAGEQVREQPLTDIIENTIHEMLGIKIGGCSLAHIAEKKAEGEYDFSYIYVKNDWEHVPLQERETLLQGLTFEHTIFEDFCSPCIEEHPIEVRGEPCKLIIHYPWKVQGRFKNCTFEGCFDLRNGEVGGDTRFIDPVVTNPGQTHLDGARLSRASYKSLAPILPITAKTLVAWWGYRLYARAGRISPLPFVFTLPRVASWQEALPYWKLIAPCFILYVPLTLCMYLFTTLSLELVENVLIRLIDLFSPIEGLTFSYSPIGLGGLLLAVVTLIYLMRRHTLPLSLRGLAQAFHECRSVKALSVAFYTFYLALTSYRVPSAVIYALMLVGIPISIAFVFLILYFIEKVLPRFARRLPVFF